MCLCSGCTPVGTWGNKKTCTEGDLTCFCKLCILEKLRWCTIPLSLRWLPRTFFVNPTMIYLKISWNSIAEKKLRPWQELVISPWCSWSSSELYVARHADYMLQRAMNQKELRDKHVYSLSILYAAIKTFIYCFQCCGIKMASSSPWRMKYRLQTSYKTKGIACIWVSVLCQ